MRPNELWSYGETRWIKIYSQQGSYAGWFRESIQGSRVALWYPWLFFTRQPSKIAPHAPGSLQEKLFDTPVRRNERTCVCVCVSEQALKHSNQHSSSTKQTDATHTHTHTHTHTQEYTNLLLYFSINDKGQLLNSQGHSKLEMCFFRCALIQSARTHTHRLNKMSW